MVQHWIDATLNDTFATKLKKAYELRDAELMSDFGRSLPMQDAMDDRWSRAKRLGFGTGTSIYNSAVVFQSVRVGRETWIGPYVLLDGSGGGIEIGDTCSISASVHIYTHDTIGWALSGGKRATRKAPVKIGSCTYIGSQSVIGAGVKIGTRCVVSANSFVNHEVPDSTIVGGNPARRIGIVEFRDGEPVLVFDNGSVTAVTAELE